MRTAQKRWRRSKTVTNYEVRACIEVLVDHYLNKWNGLSEEEQKDP